MNTRHGKRSVVQQFAPILTKSMKILKKFKKGLTVAEMNFALELRNGKQNSPAAKRTLQRALESGVHRGLLRRKGKDDRYTVIDTTKPFTRSRAARTAGPAKSRNKKPKIHQTRGSKTKISKTKPERQNKSYKTNTNKVKPAKQNNASKAEEDSQPTTSTSISGTTVEESSSNPDVSTGLISLRSVIVGEYLNEQQLGELSEFGTTEVVGGLSDNGDPEITIWSVERPGMLRMTKSTRRSASEPVATTVSSASLENNASSENSHESEDEVMYS